jgi:hypothetical protein
MITELVGILAGPHSLLTWTWFARSNLKHLEFMCRDKHQFQGAYRLQDFVRSKTGDPDEKVAWNTGAY